MIKPAHVRHILPLGIALVTGAALQPVIGFSLIAFVCSVGARVTMSKPLTENNPNGAFVRGVGALIEVAASVVCFVYAIWLAVNP